MVQFCQNVLLVCLPLNVVRLCTWFMGEAVLFVVWVSSHLLMEKICHLMLL